MPSRTEQKSTSLGDGTSGRNSTRALPGGVRVGLLVEAVTKIERWTRLETEPKDLQPDDGPEFVRWCLADGERVGLVDPDALLGCIADLLTGQNPQARHRREESWPNAF